MFKKLKLMMILSHANTLLSFTNNETRINDNNEGSWRGQGWGNND